MNNDRNDNSDDEIPGLRGLKLDQLPQRDLWTGIEARLQRKPRGRLRSRIVGGLGLAMAASLLAAVTLGVLQQAPPPENPAETVARAPSPMTTAARSVGHVNPQRQALLKANLAIVKDAEGQLRQALEQDPDSAALRRLLLAMQQQRGDLKRQLTRDAHEHNT